MKVIARPEKILRRNRKKFLIVVMQHEPDHKTYDNIVYRVEYEIQPSKTDQSMPLINPRRMDSRNQLS